MQRNIRKELESTLGKRVLILDGAMGTMIQRLGLSEDDFRGDRFTSPLQPNLKGCNDVMNLTQPEIIRNIHLQYLEAGADIIETNTFNSNDISMADYGLISIIEDLNKAGAELAREAVMKYRESGREESDRPIFVAGSMGPSNISLSIDDGLHHTDFDSMEKVYYRQAKALIEGGVDIILLETVFDTLNAKAAVHGIRRAMRDTDIDLPLIISITLTKNNRLLTGQTLEAFITSMQHSDAFCYGLNCGFGAEEMSEAVEWLALNIQTYVSAYPNAGLPDEMGNYSQTPEKMLNGVRNLLDNQSVNIIGGCCGTTPAHIQAIAEVIREYSPRIPVANERHLCVSASENLDIDRCGSFIRIGERCNVAGSRKFLRLIGEGKYNEALDIAADQIKKGATILDINMDDAMLDTATEMESFLKLLGTDSRTAAVPVMIDSSDINVVRKALKCLPGRSVVNSISLKNGEEDFIEKAKEIRSLGATVVVMAFDEKGQADTLERRKEILKRACRLLTERASYSLSEIVVDPNILAVATGIGEHDRYALDFLETISWIKRELPGVKVSGGVSNLSFAFRGNDKLRKAMHSIFLEEGIKRGLDMAIVNPAVPITSEWIDKDEADVIREVFLTGDANASENLIELASELKKREETSKRNNISGHRVSVITPSTSASVQLSEMVISGRSDNLETILKDTLKQKGSAMEVINETLMAAMTQVGELFAKGSLFLPQVVKSATVLRNCIEWLTPYIESENGTVSLESNRPLMVIATVKGDVHDIGKNIVSIVMRCSGFRVIDLGVMVSPEEIVETAKREKADIVGLSGLITPSLAEMVTVVKMLEKAGMEIPVFIGGATTSDLHTAVKIAPCYRGSVVHTTDAADLSISAKMITDKVTGEKFIRDNSEKQNILRSGYRYRKSMLPLEKCRELGDFVSKGAEKPLVTGISDMEISTKELLPYINWRAFLGEWSMNPGDMESKEASRLINDARRIIEESKGNIRIRVALTNARRINDDIEITHPETGEKVMFPTLRCEVPNPVDGKCRSLSDYISEDQDWIALFAATTSCSGFPEMIIASEGKDEYQSLMLQTVSHRLAEAATQWAHSYLGKEIWPSAKDSIRPAIGYAILPDQSEVMILDTILNYQELGIVLTENGAMSPSATTTGFILGNPSARYFEVGPVSKQQFDDYCIRRGIAADRMKDFIMTAE